MTLWRWLRRLLIGLAVVAVLMVIGAALYTHSFSPEDEDWDGQRAALASRTIEPLPLAVAREPLLADVRELASPKYTGRGVDTEGSRLAREYLVGRLQALDVPPLLDAYTQPFEFKRRSRRSGSDGKRMHGTNVLGLIRGTVHPDRYLVISAHYDHLGEVDGRIHPGADDNASGVAAVLAAAAHYRAHPPRHSIVFALFDAEESGLRGARHFIDAKTLPVDAIRLNLNLDMVSRSADHLLFATGTWQHPALKALTDPLRARSALLLLYGHDRPRPFWDQEDWVHASDHGPFHDAGVPFLYFGVPDHDGYHSPRDTFDGITPDFFVEAAGMALNVLDAADRRD
jgi:hypothetical protein